MAREQAEVVERTLKELGLEDKHRLLVANKMDLVVPDSDGSCPATLPSMERYPSVLVSAARGWNLQELLNTIAIHLKQVLVVSHR